MHIYFCDDNFQCYYLFQILGSKPSNAYSNKDGFTVISSLVMNACVIQLVTVN